MKIDVERFLRERFNSVEKPDNFSFADFVLTESQSDPNFFKWFFSENFSNNFDTDLTESQREKFNCFIKSIS